jgi:trehalose 6-phosphate phosphatase
MRNILSLRNRAVLQQYAWSNALVALDFDGTLAPIVSRPQLARMRASTRRLLASLVELYPCTVISGRAQADVIGLLEGVPVRSVIGNHGLEPLRATRALAVEVTRWRAALQAMLANERGVQIEDKKYSIAVHYRLSRTKKQAREKIMRAARSLGAVRLIGGKLVVNILPTDAPHKGVALERERARLGCDTAIYVGDDETDEDVFTLDQPGQLLTIRVGHKRSSAAHFYLDAQSAIDELLRELIDLRASAASLARARTGV